MMIKIFCVFFFLQCYDTLNLLYHYISIHSDCKSIPCWSCQELQVHCKSYSRDDALGLPDAPHLRGVQNEGGLALDLLAEAVRVQHLVAVGFRTRREEEEEDEERGEEAKQVSIFKVVRSSSCSR